MSEERGDEVVTEVHCERQPTLAAPGNEPERHWKLKEGRATGELQQGRRSAEEVHQGLSSQGNLLTGATHPIDILRDELRDWRKAGYPGGTSTTRRLLGHWREQGLHGDQRPLFFAQREAVETIAYLTDVGNGSHWRVRQLQDDASEYSRGLLRIGVQMATGTGKTRVMAALIAWYACSNRRGARNRAGGLARNVDRVVVVCPGRTIRRQLESLDPRRGPESRRLYEELLPADMQKRMGRIRVDVVNYEQLVPRKGLAVEGIEAGGGTGFLTKKQALELAGAEEAAEETETREEVWKRVLQPRRAHGRRERTVVLNDEGHHCWERKRGETPGVWMEALHTLAAMPGHELAQVVDLTATPRFIDPAKTHVRSGGKLPQRMPWVVSEFNAADARETGLVKITRKPRWAKGIAAAELRNLYEANNGKALWKRATGFQTAAMVKVRNAVEILYASYEETFAAWTGGSAGGLEPVFIVVANTKENARGIFELIGGGPDEQGGWTRGACSLLSNAGSEMRTILVQSRASPEKDAADSITGGFLGTREVGRKGVTQDELREVLATVGEPGKPGATVRCVVSVGMLTEGWDCQLVTHILGYRKFDSELLAEQTTGRALRRRDYENTMTVQTPDMEEPEQRYPAEYATVFGIPVPEYELDEGEGEGDTKTPEPPVEIHPVAERVGMGDLRVEFPRFAEYVVTGGEGKIQLAEERVRPTSPRGKPVDPEEAWARIRVEGQGSIGSPEWIEAWAAAGPGYGPWVLAGVVYAEIAAGRWEKWEWEGGSTLFGECLEAAKAWLDHPATGFYDADMTEAESLEDAKQALLSALDVVGAGALERRGVPQNEERLWWSAGEWRPFKTVLKRRPEITKSELNRAPCHSGLEVRITGVLETSTEVTAFLRNHGPERFEVPYKYGGGWARYVPDFIVRGRTREGLTPMLLVEGKGPVDEKAEAKKQWTREWWAPAANFAAREAGRREAWGFVEVRPGEDAAQKIEQAIEEARKS